MSLISSKNQLTLPVEVMRAAGIASGELLIAPLREGKQEHVEQTLVGFSIQTATVDMALAQRAAAVRARTSLKLPDAYALATAIHLEHRGRTDVRLATFDKKVLKAHRELHPPSS